MLVHNVVKFLLKLYVFAYSPGFNYSSFDISSQIYNNYQVDFNFSPWLQMNYYVTKMGKGGMGFKKLDEN